jgi:hypothetical protein
MPPRPHTPSRARQLLPRSIAVLGELGPMVLAVEGRSGSYEYHGVPWRPGSILCASASGREMFIVRPMAGAGPGRINQQAIQALGLHERFTHRRANELYNCAIPSLRNPEYRGQIAIIHYFQEKHFDDAPDAAPSEYIHYFEKPGERPAYVDLYSVGHNQYYIPAGEWVASSAGIEYAPARRRRYA